MYEMTNVISFIMFAMILPWNGYCMLNSNKESFNSINSYSHSQEVNRGLNCCLILIGFAINK